MKRILTLCLFSFLISSALSAQNRLVFIEEFTQASCPPCEATSPALNAVMAANAEKVVEIRYHTSWPGVDPMNADNPADVQARVDYYGVTGVPNLRIDGVVATGSGNQLVTPAEIDARYALASDVSMELTHDYNDDNSGMMISLSITNDGTDAYSVASNRLRIAIVEELITWPFTPGSTSLTEFHAVMKDFVTDVSGMMLPEIGAGETWSESWMVDVPPTWYALGQLGVVAWVQDDQTQTVINSAESHAVELNGDYTDIAATNGVTSESFCEETVSPDIMLINNGTVDITEATIVMAVNGEEVATETFSGTLAAGSSQAFSFSEIDRMPGGAEYSFVVTTVNGATSDVDRFNGITSAVFVGTFGSYTSLDETFEGYAFRDLGDFIVERSYDLAFVTVTPAAFNTTANVGNFSPNSMLIDFWGWSTVGDEANLYYGEVDMTTATDPTFTFTYTGASFQTSQDELNLEVSTDCGDSWTTLWSARGAELATQGPINDARYVPAFSSTWVPVEVDLSAYIGNANVSFRMRAVSGYGNATYIDNLAISGITTSNDNVVDASLASIYPNPVNATAMIDLDLAEANEVVLQVSDINGKVIDTKSYGQLSGAHTLRYDVDALTSGIYIFNIVAGDVVSPQRVSVIK